VCGRYSLSNVDPAALRARFGLREAIAPSPRYNIAPGSDVLAVLAARDGGRSAQLLRWGLVPGFAASPAVGARMINARVETLGERAAFRGALADRRCLIPADGFYEWRAVPGTRRKQAFHITLAAGGIFAFAGLWAVWRPGGPDELRSATIITTTARGPVATVHDRMPVILDPADEAGWLDQGASAAALWPVLRGIEPQALKLRAVGPAVNDAAFDGPECLLDAPEPAQGSLFA